MHHPLPVRAPSRRGFLTLLTAAATLSFVKPALAQELTVEIDNFTFSPDRLEIKAGSTVLWKNDDDIPHSIVATGKQFRSPALDTGETFRFTFTTPGTYDYFCGLHPHMTAKIIVTS